LVIFTIFFPIIGFFPHLSVATACEDLKVIFE